MRWPFSPSVGRFRRDLCRYCRWEPVSLSEDKHTYARRPSSSISRFESIERRKLFNARQSYTINPFIKQSMSIVHTLDVYVEMKTKSELNRSTHTAHSQCHTSNDRNRKKNGKTKNIGDFVVVQAESVQRETSEKEQFIF